MRKKTNAPGPPSAPSLDFVPTLDRRCFFRVSAAGAAGMALGGPLAAGQEPEKPRPIATNVATVSGTPRTASSMPGRHPGKVVALSTGDAAANGAVKPAAVHRAVEQGMLALTGATDVAAAWRSFVGPEDVVGIKVNPIGGALLSTRPEVVDAVIAGLAAAGVERSRIVIWDRREFQLAEAGFTASRFPGVTIAGTEVKGPNGDFYDGEGRLWARDNIDREHPAYVADVEMSYGRETLPYMINEGRESYFTKLVTRRCTKIVNVPVLKNTRDSVSACLKNLSYGSLSNTGRLHKLWARSVAEPCAFPCLRDKVALNIVDGLLACYDGGPGANPEFIWDANLMLFGTDPVAVDAVALDVIGAERLRRGVVKSLSPRGREYMEIAAALGLGVADRDLMRVIRMSLEG